MRPDPGRLWPRPDGPPPAAWLRLAFAALTALTLWRSLHHLLAADGGAETIATIPLGRFSPEAQAAVIGVFALWGLSQLLLGLVQLAALIRFPALIPPLLLVMAGEYAARIAILAAKPIPVSGTAPGGVLNGPMLVLCLALALAATLAPRD